MAISALQRAGDFVFGLSNLNQRNNAHNVAVSEQKIIERDLMVTSSLEQARVSKFRQQQDVLLKQQQRDDAVTYQKRRKRLKLVGNLLISVPFAIGCGLAVMGSFLTMTAALFPAAPVLACLLASLPFFGFTTFVNIKIQWKKMPAVMSAVFSGKLRWGFLPSFRGLFSYNEAEYHNMLKNYFAEMDDRIDELRAKLTVLNDKKDANGKLSWIERRQVSSAKNELRDLLNKRNRNVIPSRALPWYKRLIVGLSLPLNAAGGVIFGVLTYTLTLKSLFAGLLLLSPTLVSPPLLLMLFCGFLGVVTAPAIAAIFVHGVSGLVKVRNALKISFNFILDFFKETVKNPLGEGNIKIFSRASVLKGSLKLLFLTALVGLVTFGQVFQMLGGGSIFLEMFNGAAEALAMYVLPAMACAALLPFYWLQTFITGKGWFSNGLDYFKDPVKVLDRRIIKIEALIKGNQLGKAKGARQIEALETQQAQVVYDKQHQTVKMPFWLRDILTYQVFRVMNAVGNGFISLYGALTSGGQTTPDANDPSVTQPTTPDTSHSLSPQDALADLGGMAASFCAATKDAGDGGPATKIAQIMKDMRYNRKLSPAALLGRQGALTGEREPLLAAYSGQQVFSERYSFATTA